METYSTLYNVCIQARLDRCVHFISAAIKQNGRVLLSEYLIYKTDTAKPGHVLGSLYTQQKLRLTPWAL